MDDTRPAALFRRAAALLEQALIKLDATKDECGGCGRAHYRNKTEGVAYERFTDTPTKLHQAADILDAPRARIQKETTNDHQHA